jgi:hypothetical protein
MSGADHALAVVLDADRAEAERVAWLSRLNDFPGGLDTARALVPLLNEPLDWLAREAFALLAAPHAPDVAVGVARGLLAPGATSLAELIDDAGGCVRACPDLGPVVAVRHATLFLPRLAEEPRWARTGPHGTAWLRRLDRDPPLLHLLRDGGTLAFSLGRGDDGAWHAHPTSAPDLVRVALRTGRVVLVPERADGSALCAIDGAPLVRATALAAGQRLTVAGRPLLEVAALAPVWTVGHGGDEGEAHGAWPWPGETAVEPSGAGHVMHLPFGARGVVSYGSPRVDPIARIVPPETRATVGALRIDEHDALEVVS